jgi:glycyl-tRNA synthetase
MRARQLDNYGGPELGELCRKYDLRNSNRDTALREPVAFNLIS